MKSFSDPKPVKIKLKPGGFIKPKPVLKEITNESNVNEYPPELLEPELILHENENEDDEEVLNDMLMAEETNSINSENFQEVTENDEDVSFDDDFNADDIEKMEMEEMHNQNAGSAQSKTEEASAVQLDETIIDDDWDGTLLNEDIDELLDVHLSDLPLCENEDKEKVYFFSGDE